MIRRAKAGKVMRHYSGDESRAFWARVNNPKLDEKEHRALYCTGILLQEMEARILTWLENAERESGQRFRERSK